jgi:outer membrane protein OmpA-like peptidoglycan-associated protein
VPPLRRSKEGASIVTGGLVAVRLARVAAASLVLACSSQAFAQQVEQGVAIVSESIASSVDGFSYSPDSSSELEFVGTSLAPRSVGEGSIRVSHDKTEINVKLQRLPEPSSLGPFTIYILWVVTPEGRAINVGVLNSDGEKARIEATTPLSSFALIVTAEPHFAVSIPSKYIVLQNVGANGVKGTKLTVKSLAAREDYSGLKPIVQDPKHPLPLDLRMARYAVAIAEAVGAKDQASAAFVRARQSLDSAEAAYLSKKYAEHARVGEFAREAIQAGEDARAGAEIHRLDTEKASEATLVKDWQQSVKTEQAKVAQLQSDLAGARARTLAAEEQLPTPSKRLALASELLSRWFTVPPPTEAGLAVHVPEDMFAKGGTDLLPQMQDRLNFATGVLLGIGKLSVAVTPSVQISTDMQKLALSQQRARALMEKLASMGPKATMGTASADAETALAIGPGVDLLIAAATVDLPKPDAAQVGTAAP